MKRKINRIRLAALAALGFGSLVSCNPEDAPCMYGPGPLMYGPPPTEMIPEPAQPEMSESPAPADSEMGAEAVSK
ncbi:MAG: hypothetical protein MJZ17_09000 [Bacteroidales bacterium]|nr:hypothetical protein [Bacteroidales bacterium]